MDFVRTLFDKLRSSNAKFGFCHTPRAKQQPPLVNEKLS